MGPYILSAEILKAPNDGAVAPAWPQPQSERTPILSVSPPVSREGGNVFLEDSPESSRIHSFTGVRVPEGTNHICKGCWCDRGEGAQRLVSRRAGKSGKKTSRMEEPGKWM